MSSKALACLLLPIGCLFAPGAGASTAEPSLSEAVTVELVNADVPAASGAVVEFAP